MRAKISARVVQALEPQRAPFEVVDADLKGFLLRVQPSGVKTYYFAYRNKDGRRQRYRIGASESLTPAQARDQAVLIAARVVMGEDVQVQRKQQRRTAKLAQSRTLEAFLTRQYERWVTSQRKSGATTIQRIRSNFGHLLARPMGDISLWVIEKWRSEALKAGKARTTVNRDVMALKACLSKAVEWGVLETHPLQGLKPLRTDRLSRTRYLSPAEETALREALAERDRQLKAERASGNAWRAARHQALLPDLAKVTFADHLWPMVLLSLNTGLRRGEVLLLKWRDVNLSERRLAVRGDSAKSGRTRHIPLNPEAFATLTEWRSDSESTEWVFPGQSGQPMKSIKSAWQHLLVKTGIQDFRWHDLRHTFASRLVMNGVDLNTVRELLGHADLTMTLRYAHLSPEHKADAVARLCESNAINAISISSAANR